MDILYPLALLLFVAAVPALLYFAYRRVRVLESIVTELQRRPAPGGAAGSGSRPNDVAALRLQACERFTLMAERVSVPNLLFRHPHGTSASAQAYMATLLLSIREEFEYNVTQQIYVSDALWNVLLQARDNVSQLIVRAAEDATSAAQVASRLRLMSANQPQDPIALAQAAIRREAVQLVSGK